MEGLKGIVFHDSIALIAALEEELFEFKDVSVRVCCSEERRGETARSPEGSFIKVAVDFDLDGFKKYMAEIFS
jgi:inosine-uridine nucleoside N-ribohydrolase